jgi:hypothetical protein
LLLVLSSVLVLAAGSVIRAEETKSPAKELSNVDKATSPHLVIESLEHEFGKVRAGTPLAYTFKLKNKGKGDLAITEVKPSCGCTKGDFDKVIKPGKTGKITLTIDKTDKYVGKTVKTARVTTNDPENAAFTLTMRADFISDHADAKPTQ